MGLWLHKIGRQKRNKTGIKQAKTNLTYIAHKTEATETDTVSVHDYRSM